MLFRSQEALILSSFAFRKICGDESLCLKDIIEWLKIPGIEQVPEIYESITSLIKSDLLTREVSRWEKKEGHYSLSDNAFKAIVTGDSKILETDNIEDFHSLLSKILSLYYDLRFDLMDGDDFQTKIHWLLEKSFELPEIQWLCKYNLDINERQLIIIMAAHKLHYPEKSVDVERILQRIEKRYYLMAKDIMNGRNTLMRENLIAFATNEFKTLEEMKLTEISSDNLGLNGTDEEKPKNLEYGQLIFPENIKSKKIFYNNDVEIQIEGLKKIIDVFQNYDIKKTDLSSVKLMIYGPSGTGKSQTILNMARETGSIIYEVGHHLIKNPYVGMTEAAYAGMFKEYYKIRERYKKQGKNVWFVINEFEGLVSRRIAAHNSVDFMVSTATSIFLKETDSTIFNGVLLLTLNNIHHTDVGILRRMTLKINMSEPNNITRKKIMADRFPFLEEKDIEQI